MTGKLLKSIISMYEYVLTLIIDEENKFPYYTYIFMCI